VAEELRAPIGDGHARSGLVHLDAVPLHGGNVPPPVGALQPRRRDGSDPRECPDGAEARARLAAETH
jgi:hypothetical protein